MQLSPMTLGTFLNLLELSFLLYASILWTGFKIIYVSVGQVLKNFPSCVSAQRVPLWAFQKYKVIFNYFFNTS